MVPDPPELSHPGARLGKIVGNAVRGTIKIQTAKESITAIAVGDAKSE